MRARKQEGERERETGLQSKRCRPRDQERAGEGATIERARGRKRAGERERALVCTDRLEPTINGRCCQSAVPPMPPHAHKRDTVQSRTTMCHIER